MNHTKCRVRALRALLLLLSKAPPQAQTKSGAHSATKGNAIVNAERTLSTSVSPGEAHAMMALDGTALYLHKNLVHVQADAYHIGTGSNVKVKVGGTYYTNKTFGG